MRLALHWQILIGMVIGAVIGLTLNATQGSRTWSSTADDALPAGVVEAEVSDSSDLTTIRWRTDEGEFSASVDGSRKTEGSVASIKDLEKKYPVAHEIFMKHGRSFARVVGDGSQWAGGLFLRLLKMVALPLIVSSLISGVMGLGDASRLGRMFGRTMTYYLATSMLAICTGLLMVNTIRPGLQADSSNRPAATTAAGEVGDQDMAAVLMKQLENAIPPNPFGALAGAEFLSVISFSIAFAVFALLHGGDVAKRVKSAADTVFQVMMRMTMAIIRLAPVGVLFLMLYVTATQGPEVFKLLAWYIVAVMFALIIHSCITLPLILRFVAKRNPWEYAKAMSPALLTAFSSASSNGTLPLTMASVENRAGVDNKVSSFVLPLGATINMDGTALYEAVAVLFIAQMHYGINPTLTTQILVAVTALLASIGAAGIPHAGLVMMVIVLQVVGLPAEMQGVVLAVDRVLDMCRTSVNVWSDSCGCAVVARFENDPQAEVAAG